MLIERERGNGDHQEWVSENVINEGELAEDRFHFLDLVLSLPTIISCHQLHNSSVMCWSYIPLWMDGFHSNLLPLSPSLFPSLSLSHSLSESFLTHFSISSFRSCVWDGVIFSNVLNIMMMITSSFFLPIFFEERLEREQEWKKEKYEKGGKSFSGWIHTVTNWLGWKHTLESSDTFCSLLLYTNKIHLDSRSRQIQSCIELFSFLSSLSSFSSTHILSHTIFVSFYVFLPRFFSNTYSCTSFSSLPHILASTFLPFLSFEKEGNIFVYVSCLPLFKSLWTNLVMEKKEGWIWREEKKRERRRKKERSLV